jgi:peroxiredoxin
VRTCNHKIAIVLSTLITVAFSNHGNAEPPATSVAEIQAKHDRAFIRDLTGYLREHTTAGDRDQAYAALFNKAIEHDWFAETEELGKQYLKAEPEGPVKSLAQIVITMARAHAGQFDEAIARFRELMQGLNQNDQEEFAASFSDSFATVAMTAGEYAVTRQIYETLLSRFGESPTLRQKVQKDLTRLDRVGKPAPQFAVADVNGKSLKLDSYHGKYVLLDFWATWCSPCIAELPRIQAAFKAYHDAGFEVIGISLDESKAAVVDFVKARGIPWQQIHNGSAAMDLAEAFGVGSIPATYLIDPQGRIIRLDLRGAALDQVLGSLLKGKAVASGARTIPR